MKTRVIHSMPFPGAKTGHRTLKESDKLSMTADAVPVLAHDPIGRNDPCPCGSGKKRKKCCKRSVLRTTD